MNDSLAAIEARLKARTPGEWKAEARWTEMKYRNSVCEIMRTWLVVVKEKPMNALINDAEFIAHAPTDLAYLLARLKAAEHACRAMQLTLQYVPSFGDRRGKLVDGRDARTIATDALTTWEAAK